MHERSLVQALLEQVRAEARRRGLGRVHGVCVDVGNFSGVEPALVRSAFEETAPAFFGVETALELRTTSLRARCRDCATEFSVERFRFSCPACSGEVDITAGEEFRLVSITAEPPVRAGRRDG